MRSYSDFSVCNTPVSLLLFIRSLSTDINFKHKAKSLLLVSSITGYTMNNKKQLKLWMMNKKHAFWFILDDRIKFLRVLLGWFSLGVEKDGEAAKTQG